ncbi:MAG: protein TolR [Ottowia sp.]|nr:protein TolR [Ottowia sp.]
MANLFYTRKRRRAMADINVVPYIDVMLVLLVIFMVVAPMSIPGVVNLPTVGAAAVQQQSPLLITLHADASLEVSVHSNAEQFQQKLGRTQLFDLLKQRQARMPDQPVVIAADKSVQYEAVMSIMDALKNMGIKRVGLLVKSN